MTQIENKTSTSISLGYTFFGSVYDVDPIEILTIYQSNLIENLYSRLIEYDNAGQLVCSLCSSFYVKENVVYFAFGNSRTIDGHMVGPLDAKKSLERVAASQTNTHGSLSYYLDKKSDLPIEVAGEQLTIKVARADWVPFVLSLLASMDFSVIPRDSLSFAENKIRDYRNTSGLYYVKSADESGNIRLGVNFNHANYKKRMIDEIQIVPIKSGQAQKAFADGLIDMVDPTYYAYEREVEAILKTIPNANVHKTVQIGITSLVFSRKAIATSSVGSRMAAAQSVEKWFREKTDRNYGAQETDQYFQSFGPGFINSEQKESLNKLAAMAKPSECKFVLGLTEKYRSWTEDYKFPDNIEVRFFKSYPGFLPDQDRPDVYLVTADSSFDEDISALSYLFSQDIFSHGRDDGALWIQDYMNLPSRDLRIERLRDLHFEVLSTVKVYPLISRPYVAISRPEFDMDFSKMHAGSPMWKVRKK